jgi:hypothetical protein
MWASYRDPLTFRELASSLPSRCSYLVRLFAVVIYRKGEKGFLLGWRFIKQRPLTQAEGGLHATYPLSSNDSNTITHSSVSLESLGCSTD